MVKLLRALDCALTAFVNELSPYNFPLLTDSVAESLEEATIVKTYASLSVGPEEPPPDTSWIEFQDVWGRKVSAVESPASAPADEVPPVAAAPPCAATGGQPLTPSQLDDAAFAMRYYAENESAWPESWFELADKFENTARAMH